MAPSSKQLLAGVIFLSLWGCKEKIEYLPPLCETRNYGTLQVNFKVAFTKHTISIEMPDKSIRKKLVFAGNTIDTLHLPPGDYKVDVALLDDSGNEFISDFQNQTVVKCSETKMDVPF